MSEMIFWFDDWEGSAGISLRTSSFWLIAFSVLYTRATGSLASAAIIISSSVD